MSRSAAAAPLDLFSTSQTEASEVATCAYNAPHFAIKLDGRLYRIIQGNCHHWDCPKCGIGRAKLEYGRIVNGCEILDRDHQLYFITITCRGRDMSLAESEASYLKWTNRLLTTLRKDAKKRGVTWSYAQVTERQKRGHPHSHILTTYYPDDLKTGVKDNWKTVAGKRTNEPVECLRSEYLEKRCTSAGLGNQYDISEVREHQAASRYVAKYMFKDSMFEQSMWPKGWRRVRYSQSFPKLPEREKSEALPLIKQEDWRRLARLAAVVAPTREALEAVEQNLRFSDCLIKQPN